MLMSPRFIRLVTGEAMSKCPRCGTRGLRRSQVRFYEKLRKALSSSRPYRCNGCQLRVWGRVPPTEAVEVGPDGATSAAWPQGAGESLDLSALDRLS
jgi:hypothetical protein